MVKDSKFIPFKSDVSAIPLPSKFTFPFYYEPHILSKIAVDELQYYIENQDEWEHNFGLKENQSGMIIGKMFGVLVVQNKNGELGYLAAFSGKLADKNEHAYFVPPVFDMLTENSFYKLGEQKLYEMTDEIKHLENSEKRIELHQNNINVIATCEKEMQSVKEKIKNNKELRRSKREHAEKLPLEIKNVLLEQLKKESIKEQFFLKDLIKTHKEKKRIAFEQWNNYENSIIQLKQERKKLSNEIQNQLFDSYYFFDALGNKASLLTLFKHAENGKPPSGAGECCAPKLLQYAFLHQLKPIALAEFWWGASPVSEIRKHKQFYPACKGKCEPILKHMLQGLNVDENPMDINPAEGKELEIVYEDEALIIINKPAEFLSVPGKTIVDSVATRMKTYLPYATGPLLVHRLDMSTSGILLIAKTKESHDFLQQQFIKRTIKKRYIALLEGEINEKKGIIDLPLRVDLDDRPRQLVCYQHGKTAKTEWELVESRNGYSKVYFYPITGRTHQLRVHAAHQKGLGKPIVGDDLYGNKAKRLCLHAESITFVHPISRKEMTFRVEENFDI